MNNPAQSEQVIGSTATTIVQPPQQLTIQNVVPPQIATQKVATPQIAPQKVTTPQIAKQKVVPSHVAPQPHVAPPSNVVTPVQDNPPSQAGKFVKLCISCSVTQLNFYP